MSRQRLNHKTTYHQFYFQMRHFIIALVFSLVYVGSVRAQESARIPSAKPKLIVGINITQFRYDYIPRYWDKFCDGGFKRLINRGSYCENTAYNYLFSDLGVGSATIVTGSNPSTHGIIASSWYNNLKDETENYIYDDNVRTVGGGYDAGMYSPKNLMVPTLGDQIKLASNFKSKVISICMDPAPAIFTGGHTADCAYWFDSEKGNWISSSYYIDSLPQWVKKFNNQKLPDTYLQNKWETLLPMSEYTASLLDNNDYEKGIYGQKVFPYILKDIVKKEDKKDKYGILRSVPFGNNLAKDFAIQAIVGEKLGQGPNTDLLMINFTVGERLSNLYGPLSVEMEDNVLRLDRDLAHLLDFLDNTIGKENVLVFLTAEHGAQYMPAYLTDHKIPGGYFNAGSAISLLRSYMGNIYGKGEWIKQYHGQQIYLNRTLIEDAKLNLADVQNNVASLMLQFSGVANTVTATTLQNTDFTHGIFSTMQNGYNQKRSGDVLINLKTGWSEKPIDEQSSSNDNDPRVPLIFYGWKIGRNTIHRRVDLTDITPTICSLLEISTPGSVSGKPILEILK